MPFEIPSIVPTQSIPAGGAGALADPGAWSAAAQAASTADLTAARIGAAAAQGGSMIEQRALQIQAQQDHLDASTLIANEHSQRVQMLATARQAAPENAAGMHDQLAQQFSQRTQDLIENARPGMRALLQLGLTRVDTRVLDEAAIWEANQRNAAAERVTLQSIGTQANAARLDDSQYETSLQAAQDAVAGAGLNPAQRARAGIVARQEVTRSMLLGLADRNPGRAQAMLNSGRFNDALSPEQTQAIAGHIDLRLRQGTAEAQRTAREGELRAQGNVTSLLHDELPAIESTGRGMGANGEVLLTPDVVRAAYPNDPRRVQQVLGQVEIAQRSYEISQRMAGASPQEIAGMRAQLVDEVTRRVQSDAGRPADAFERAHIQRESGGDATRLNTEGFVGLYQFGAPALQALGMYRPGQGESLRNWSAGGAARWTGTFTIPGHPEVHTLAGFQASPEAQRVAYLAHVDLIDRQLAPELQRYEGQIVGGAPITRSSLRAMAMLGGIEGTRRFLATGGQYNPADSNGTSLRSDAIQFAHLDARTRTDPAAPGEVEPGVAGRQQLLQHFDELAARRFQQLEQHPADQVARELPQVQQLFREAQTATEQNQPDAAQRMELAMSTLVEAQRHAGVPEDRITPLTTAGADAFARSFAASQTPRDRLGMLLRITDHGDPAIRQGVINQIAGRGPEGNRIPQEVQSVLDMAQEPARRSTAENWLAALMVPRRDLAQEQPADRLDIQAKVGDVFDGRSGMGGLLARQATVTGGGDGRLNPRYLDQATRERNALVAVARATGVSGSYGDAVRRSYEDRYGHLDIVSADAPERPQGALAEAAVPRGTDRAMLLRGMEVARDSEADRLAAAMQPPTDAGPLALRQHQAVVADLRARGTWVNEGDHLALVSPASGSVVARMSLADLLAVGRASAPTPEQAAAAAQREQFSGAQP